MAEEITLDFIGRSLLALHDEMRGLRNEMQDVRKENRDMRTIVLQSIDQVRRVRDDLELMICSEMMGRTAHFETQLDRQFGDLRARIDALETAAH